MTNTDGCGADLSLLALEVGDFSLCDMRGSCVTDSGTSAGTRFEVAVWHSRLPEIEAEKATSVARVKLRSIAGHRRLCREDQAESVDAGKQ